jgi:hypothetical protein
MQDIDYRDKYLKYKAKYQNLQYNNIGYTNRQWGGTTIAVSDIDVPPDPSGKIEKKGLSLGDVYQRNLDEAYVAIKKHYDDTAEYYKGDTKADTTKLDAYKAALVAYNQEVADATTAWQQIMSKGIAKDFEVQGAEIVRLGILEQQQKSALRQQQVSEPAPYAVAPQAFASQRPTLRMVAQGGPSMKGTGTAKFALLGGPQDPAAANAAADVAVDAAQKEDDEMGKASDLLDKLMIDIRSGSKTPDEGITIIDTAFSEFKIKRVQKFLKDGKKKIVQIKNAGGDGSKKAAALAAFGSVASSAKSSKTSTADSLNVKKKAKVKTATVAAAAAAASAGGAGPVQMYQADQFQPGKLAVKLDAQHMQKQGASPQFTGNPQAKTQQQQGDIMDDEKLKKFIEGMLTSGVPEDKVIEMLEPSSYPRASGSVQITLRQIKATTDATLKKALFNGLKATIGIV